MRSLSILLVAIWATAALGQTATCPHCGGYRTVSAPAVSYSSSGQSYYGSSNTAPSNTPVLVASWSNGGGQAYAMAQRSALYRANNRISGHTQFDQGQVLPGGWRSGVGHAWATGYQPTSTPKTCYWSYRGQGSYAAYRVGNQVFSTLIIPQ